MPFFWEKNKPFFEDLNPPSSHTNSRRRWCSLGYE
jgi:hypothetical protein